MNILELHALNRQKILLEQHLLESQALLESVCLDLSEEQSRVVRGIHGELLPLIEAAVTVDQLTQMFKHIEDAETAAGTNRTVLGKAKDTVVKANDVINNVGKWLQDTRPVQAFDQKFEDLKKKIGEKFPALEKNLTAMGTWAKENPGKTAAIIGVLTAIASIAGGPVGGAVAGQILRGAAELLKGEKLSTAIGKGIKTAAYGFIAGKLFDLAGQYVAGIREKYIPFGPKDAGLERVSFDASRQINAPGLEYVRPIKSVDALMTSEDAETVRNAIATIKKGGEGAGKAFDALVAVSKEINSKEYMQAMEGAMKGAWAAAKQNDSLLQWINALGKGLSAASQGAVAAAGGGAAKPKTESLSHAQINSLFEEVEKQILLEGPLDFIKKVAGKVKTAAANLTTKITADKLNAAWKKAGSPTDVEAVTKVLVGAGAKPESISGAFGKVGVAPPEEALSGEGEKKPTEKAGEGEKKSEDEKKPVAGMSADEALRELKKLWDAWTDSGKNAPPDMRRLIKQMWLDAGGIKAESTRSKKPVLLEMPQLKKLAKKKS